MATTTTTTAIVVADPTKGIKVDAGIIAQPFRDEIKERVAQLHKHGIGEQWLFVVTLYERTTSEIHTHFGFHS